MTNEQRIRKVHKLMTLDPLVYAMGYYIRVQLSDDEDDCVACLLDSGDRAIENSEDVLKYQRGELRALLPSPEGGYGVSALPFLVEVTADYDDRILKRIAELDAKKNDD